MSEETLNIGKTPLVKNKACSYYKNILGCICLVIILAIFFISELTILSAIFTIFAIFYFIIANFGAIYLSALGIKKLSKYYQKNKNTRNN